MSLRKLFRKVDPVGTLTRVRLEPGDVLIARYVDGLVAPEDFEELERLCEARQVGLVVIPVYGDTANVDFVAAGQGR